MAIGGMPDHLHLLTSLPKNVALADFVRTIKTKSNGWLKKADPYYVSFAWQTGYGAFSVSPTLLHKTTSYIQHQKEHHQKRTFADEYRLFLQLSGIAYDERYFLAD